MKERLLYKPIIENFKNDYECLQEVRLYNRIIDLLLIGKSDDCPKIAMEFKLKDWKKALQQAISYQLVADYVYIVMYQKNEKYINNDLIKKNGIGLIIANSRKYEIKINPRKSNIIDNYLWENIKNNYLNRC